MSQKLTCICIDDEFPALKLIELYCSKIPTVNLIQSFSDSGEALEFIKKNKVDLAIMDIQMPKINGIDFYKQLNQITQKETVGIFISANPSFAIDAYEIDILDFILKPASFERFEKAISKVHDFINIQNNKTENYLTLKQDFLSEKVKVSDISYVEGSGEYIKIIVNTSQNQTKSFMHFQRLKDFEIEYAKYGFVRIHKSYLILKENILNSSFSSVTLKNGKNLPLGRVYKDNLKN